MAINTITVTIPTAPDPVNDDKVTFATKSWGYTVALKSFADQITTIIPQMNNDIASANVAAATAVNAPGSAGTSTTSLTIGTGTQSFTTQAGKAWQVGQTVVVANTATPTNWMAGVITAYNSGTGAMSVSVSQTNGSGTFTAWTVALSGPASPANTGVNATSGTSTAYAIAPSPIITSYQAGQSWVVQVHTTSGASPTMQVSGVATPPNLVKQAADGTLSNIGAGDLPTGWVSRVTLLNATQALVEDMPGPQTMAAVRNLTGANNATTPTTKLDLAADVVTLRNAKGQGVTRYSSGTLTCDFGLAGPAANGRDQAGAFLSSTWVYVYFIWNGSALALLASATAPSSFTGSTLPAGYTHWAFATTVRWNVSSNIQPCYVRGAKVYYQSGINALSAGAATTLTAITITGIVPPTATEFFGWADGQWSNTGAVTANSVSLYVASGQQVFNAFVSCEVAGGQQGLGGGFSVPNVGQALNYVWSSATGTRTFNTYITGFTVPNGDA